MWSGLSLNACWLQRDDGTRAGRNSRPLPFLPAIERVRPKRILHHPNGIIDPPLRPGRGKVIAAAGCRHRCLDSACQTLGGFPTDSGYCLHLLIGLVCIEVDHGGRLSATGGVRAKVVVASDPAPDAAMACDPVSPACRYPRRRNGLSRGEIVKIRRQVIYAALVQRAQLSTAGWSGRKPFCRSSLIDAITSATLWGA